MTARGQVFGHGRARSSGDLAGRALPTPVVGIAPHHTGDGYWLLTRDGGVFSFGDAPFHGATPGRGYVAITVTGDGYWTVTAAGRVAGHGNAAQHGDLRGQRLAAPVVYVVREPNGDGYWLIAADGGVFTFGSAGFHGSAAGQRLNAPVVGAT